MSSAASEVFRKWSSHLTTVIQGQDLLVLAWKLYSLGVVSKPVVDECVEGLSPMGKKTKLFSAVGDQITVDPTKFQKFIQALRNQPLLEDVADKSETIYGLLWVGLGISNIGADVCCQRKCYQLIFYVTTFMKKGREKVDTYT